MTQDLVYRLRTCAAALAAGNGWEVLARQDAIELLVEASNALDVVEPLGEPMEMIPPPAAKFTSSAKWVAAGELPPATPKPCPACGDVGARKVKIKNKKLLLTCPVCSHQWEYAA